MESDLRKLFPDPSEANEALDRFIADRLYEAGVWDSPRHADGVVYVRVLEHERDRLRLNGRLYTIDQKLHAFWLDIHTVETEVDWALHYDVIASSPRRARNAIDLHDRASDIEWEIQLLGRVKVRGEWVVTPVIQLDGGVIDGLESFYDEVSRKLIPGAEWGRNLDAFNDILRGGFGTKAGGFVLRWIDSARSRSALGHRETAQYLERKLGTCHPSNVETVREDLEACRRGEGPTLFDILVEIIREHGEGGAESDDRVELELV